MRGREWLHPEVRGHGRSLPLSCRRRGDHEGPVPLAARERPPPLRCRRGHQARPRWPGLPRRPARLRPKDHPPGPAGDAPTRPTTPPGRRPQRPRPKKRGGRKTAVGKMPELVQALHGVLENRTAGDPMKAEVVWTDLTPKEIKEDLAERDLYVSEKVVRRLLEDQGYRRHAMHKCLQLGEHKDRDAQFQNIARIKEEYLASANPLLSIDTKKRELLGTFYRVGRVYTRHGLLAYDHDFPRYADGVVIPYVLYDLRRTLAYVSLGTSHDTTAFACDSIAWWWDEFGRRSYPGATSLCLLCDGGRSNSADK